MSKKTTHLYGRELPSHLYIRTVGNYKTASICLYIDGKQQNVITFTAKESNIDQIIFFSAVLVDVFLKAVLKVGRVNERFYKNISLAKYKLLMDWLEDQQRHFYRTIKAPYKWLLDEAVLEFYKSERLLNHLQGASK